MQLQEPFSGLFNRRGSPLLDGGVRLGDILREVGAARPCQEKIGPLAVVPDDLIWVLPPGATAPPVSKELLGRLTGALDRGLAVLIWATDPAAIEAARRTILLRGTASRA